ncbi:hypothetical protein P692DRAFT_201800223 [Suillus brevipes Sb2]|nr:hypothetical protein P692DRAFT_201800223 [Suillus brevipes Sb2]
MTSRWPLLADWWGDFVPLEDWIPPRVTNRFTGWECYNMSPEVRIDTMNDHGDSTPDQYDRAYSSRDEYIKELTTGPEVAGMAWVMLIHDGNTCRRILGQRFLDYPVGTCKKPRKQSIG